MVLGLIVAHYSWEGYRKLHSTPMFWLFTGFMLLSISMLVQGIIFELHLASVFVAMYAQTVLMAIGMGAVLYSILCRE